MFSRKERGGDRGESDEFPKVKKFTRVAFGEFEQKKLTADSCLGSLKKSI